MCCLVAIGDMVGHVLVNDIFETISNIIFKISKFKNFKIQLFLSKTVVSKGGGGGLLIVPLSLVSTCSPLSPPPPKSPLSKVTQFP